jgi:4-amino-4-deoxy-L-arabinose transferase-like glycosyltransferase
MILALVLGLGFLAHVRYLTHDCPVDLSGDEAQYWDWSRQFDLSYYSKGPLVAYIIRASCAIFGDTMPAVRFPALLLGVGTSLFTYFLASMLFRSERVALGAVLLNHIVPMFVAGSILMTIDPPFFFCWAAATFFAALAVFKEKKWAWAGVGVFAGLGFLAKYAMLLWFVGAGGFILAEALSRKRRPGAGPWIASAIALVFTTPVIVWNARHGWVSFQHVAHQTGASGGSLRQGNFFEFIASQIGGINPLIAVFMIFAIIHAIRSRDARAIEMRFLVWIGLSFFACVSLTSLFAKVQVNWPAPAYFTLMILTAYFIATRLREPITWRRWRGWLYATIAVGIVTVPIVHDVSLVFPLLQRLGIDPANADYMAKLRGWEKLGQHVSRQLDELGPGALVLCDDYMQTAEMAFYVKGHPKTFYAGSYFASDPKRLTQYDMWPDRALENPQLLGRDAVYIGKGHALPADVKQAFERTGKLEEIPVVVRGVEVKSFKVWICYGFKGMKRPVNLSR